MKGISLVRPVQQLLHTDFVFRLNGDAQTVCLTGRVLAFPCCNQWKESWCHVRFCWRNPPVSSTTAHSKSKRLDSKAILAMQWSLSWNFWACEPTPKSSRIQMDIDISAPSMIAENPGISWNFFQNCTRNSDNFGMLVASVFFGFHTVRPWENFWKLQRSEVEICNGYHFDPVQRGGHLNWGGGRVGFTKGKEAGARKNQCGDGLGVLPKP